MNRFIFVTLIVLYSASVFADKVTVQDGSRSKVLTGSVLGINAERIVLDVNGQRQEIPADTILTTVYDKEPSQLNTARTAVQDSRMSEALEALSKIAPKMLTSPEMKQDFDYLQAAAKTRSALAGNADGSQNNDAEKTLNAFLKNNKNSYHYYEMVELYGELMVHLGKFDAAKTSYAELAKAQRIEYRLKAKVALGMAEVREGKIDAARKGFEEVLADSDESESAAKQKALSGVGIALCLAAEKKYEEAAEKLLDIAKNSQSENSAFQSVVYNSLGSVYAQAGKPRDAVLAYLHTDILFSSARSEHVKALTELVQLWKDIKRPDRADDVAQRLKKLYNVPPL